MGLYTAAAGVARPSPVARRGLVDGWANGSEAPLVYKEAAVAVDSIIRCWLFHHIEFSIDFPNFSYFPSFSLSTYLSIYLPLPTSPSIYHSPPIQSLSHLPIQIPDISLHSISEQ